MPPPHTSSTRFSGDISTPIGLNPHRFHILEAQKQYLETVSEAFSIETMHISTDALSPPNQFSHRSQIG